MHPPRSSSLFSHKRDLAESDPTFACGVCRRPADNNKLLPMTHFSCEMAGAEGAGFMGGISLGDDYHPNAPAAIRECRVKTISCGGCKVRFHSSISVGNYLSKTCKQIFTFAFAVARFSQKRIGYQEGTALNLKCSVSRDFRGLQSPPPRFLSAF